MRPTGETGPPLVEIAWCHVSQDDDDRAAREERALQGDDKPEGSGFAPLVVVVAALLTAGVLVWLILR